jgi:sporulation protein YabP
MQQGGICMGDEKIVLPHRLVLNERSLLTMTGVTEVVSFDELTVVLKTTLGLLVIGGKDLQLKQLTTDGGQVTVQGTVNALHYEQPREHTGWLRRLLG